MATYNIHEAKSQLSKLIDSMQRGETVIIAKAGKPMAMLVPMKRTVTRKHLGLLKGKIRIPPGFNRPLPETEPAARHPLAAVGSAAACQTQVARPFSYRTERSFCERGLYLGNKHEELARQTPGQPACGT